MTGRLDWMFRNRETGKITIGQPANLSQKLFQGITLVGIFLPRGPVRTTAAVGAVGALTWWASDELVRGVNPFRRLSGAVTLVAVVYLALRKPRVMATPSR
ncbi:hypothetical protein [Lacisediminihabitans changchengi]|uniref:Uncharacterized protein n=1 Tax=Lacisediminihabitans changchengi TaxID=2787634 RepID=A0A934SVN5_9MICO|nr:hypothetical protein [Lacisediminihabitans changchengi]MBK4348869.1 hypothetical protein [Lacisediminihabitans changchengi]